MGGFLDTCCMSEHPNQVPNTQRMATEEDIPIFSRRESLAYESNRSRPRVPLRTPRLMPMPPSNKSIEQSFGSHRYSTVKVEEEEAQKDISTQGPTKPYSRKLDDDIVVMELSDEFSFSEARLMNDWEEGFVFNREFFQQLYDDFVLNKATDFKWENKLSNEDSLVYTMKEQMVPERYKKDKIPIVRSVFLFEPCYSLDSIYKAMHLMEYRKRWDQSINLYREVEEISDVLTVVHQVNKAAIKFIEPRDFVEKKFVFMMDNKIFVYSSAVNDNLAEQEKKVTRAHTALNFQCFEVQEEGPIQLTTVMQTDFKLKLGH